MYHCIKFKADEMYNLKDNDIYTHRVLSIGFCPICSKPVCELVEFNFNGGMNKITLAGINAQNLMMDLKDDIVHSIRQLGCKKIKSKPFGWKYGLNKELKNGKIKQYACDFYGNKELIKIN